MKATDLMIDDWVKIVDDAPTMPREYHRVDWIRTGELGLDNRKIVTYPFIEPIPLTPEILEKNGFIKKKNFMQLGNFDNPPLIMWHLEEEKILHHLKHELEIHHAKNGIHVSINVEYVHELQHALRMCGIKKEIVL